MSSRLNGFFGRYRTRGINTEIDVFTEEGNRATRIIGASWCYPVGSSHSVEYEHPEGITIDRAAACRLRLAIEDEAGNLQEPWD